MSSVDNRHFGAVSSCSRVSRVLLGVVAGLFVLAGEATAACPISLGGPALEAEAGWTPPAAARVSCGRISGCNDAPVQFSSNGGLAVRWSSECTYGTRPKKYVDLLEDNEHLALDGLVVIGFEIDSCETGGMSAVERRVRAIRPELFSTRDPHGDQGSRVRFYTLEAAGRGGWEVRGPSGTLEVARDGRLPNDLCRDVVREGEIGIRPNTAIGLMTCGSSHPALKANCPDRRWDSKIVEGRANQVGRSGYATDIDKVLTEMASVDASIRDIEDRLPVSRCTDGGSVPSNALALRWEAGSGAAGSRWDASCVASMSELDPNRLVYNLVRARSGSIDEVWQSEDLARAVAGDIQVSGGAAWLSLDDLYRRVDEAGRRLIDSQAIAKARQDAQGAQTSAKWVLGQQVNRVEILEALAKRLSGDELLAQRVAVAEEAREMVARLQLDWSEEAGGYGAGPKATVERRRELLSNLEGIAKEAEDLDELRSVDSQIKESLEKEQSSKARLDACLDDLDAAVKTQAPSVYSIRSIAGECKAAVDQFEENKQHSSVDRLQEAVSAQVSKQNREIASLTARRGQLDGEIAELQRRQRARWSLGLMAAAGPQGVGSRFGVEYAFQFKRQVSLGDAVLPAGCQLALGSSLRVFRLPVYESIENNSIDHPYDRVPTVIVDMTTVAPALLADLEFSVPVVAISDHLSSGSLQNLAMFMGVGFGGGFASVYGPSVDEAEPDRSLSPLRVLTISSGLELEVGSATMRLNAMMMHGKVKYFEDDPESAIMVGVEAGVFYGM